MNSRPDIHDLSELFEALRTRHTAVYWTAITLMGFGVLGLLCLFNALVHVSPAGVP